MLEYLVGQMSPMKASACLVGIFLIACLVRKFQVSLEVSRLGLRAPRIRFRLPYGVSILTSPNTTTVTSTPFAIMIG